MGGVDKSTVMWYNSGCRQMRTHTAIEPSLEASVLNWASIPSAVWWQHVREGATETQLSGLAFLFGEEEKHDCECGDDDLWITLFWHRWF